MDKAKLKKSLAVLGIVAGVLLAGSAIASPLSFFETMATAAGTVYGRMFAEKVGFPAALEAQKKALVGDAVLGATQVPSLNIVDDTDVSNLTNSQNLFLWGKGEVLGGFFVDSTSTLGTVSTTIAGLSVTGRQEFVSSGYFNDATNTQFCVQSPFGATSTASFVGIKLTGISTTSLSFVVATSTQSTGLSTSTQGFGLSNPAQLMNVNLISSGATTGTIIMPSTITDIRSAQTTTIAPKITVIPSEYVCGVTGEGNGGSTAGATNPTNLFSGVYGILWSKIGS